MAPSGIIEKLDQEIRRITGKGLSAEKLQELLLIPRSAQRLNRFFQAGTAIHLKKGQSEQILRAMDKLAATASTTPAILAHEADADPDLPALMGPRATKLAKALRNIFREVYFDRVNRDLRLPQYGGDYDLRPFPLPGCPVDVHAMKARLKDAVKQSRGTMDRKLAKRILYAFAFFMFGEELNRAALDELFGSDAAAIVDSGVAVGLFAGASGQTLRVNGLSAFSRCLQNGEVIYVFADTPPHFASRMGPPRVYIGADSYELMDRVSKMAGLAGYCVEMGSGSGVQMIAALRQHPGIVKAVGRERDLRAIHVSHFNAALNGVEDKVMVAAEDDALSVLLEGHAASLVMMNPPFLALPEWIEIDRKDEGVLSESMKSRAAGDGIEVNLRELFPEAGWGGEDGLQVTRKFMRDAAPLPASGGQIVIYSQFAGDERGPTLIRDFIDEVGGLSFAFEPVTPRSLAIMNPQRTRAMEGQSRTVLSSGEAAASVAKLIVSALMARRDPARLRTAVKTGGPEHALATMFAGRIESSYREQGITHFHDGFVVLARDATGILV